MASLDNLQVGGPWGSPAAENPTALWWNPASIGAVEGDGQVLIEVAPTFATVLYDREDPFNGGQDTYVLSGLVPFAGATGALDTGAGRFGAGIGLAVPYARGGDERDSPGSGSFAMRHGSSQAVFMMGGLSAQPAGSPVSVGVMGAFVDNAWEALTDSELTTSYDADISSQGQQSGYTDAQIETQDYKTTLEFGHLVGRGFTFGAGARANFTGGAVAITFVNGLSLKNKGDVVLHFDCPPDSDPIGQFGAQTYGLCYSNLLADGTVGYRLPWRIHGGVEIKPSDRVRLEAMGGFVHWKQYTDFDITVANVEDRNEFTADQLAVTPGKVNQHRLWARDNQDAWWMGFDAKGEVVDRFTIGGRLMYDHHAVPTAVLSPNNYDADEVITGLVLAVEPIDGLLLSGEYTHHFASTRVVAESAYGVTLDYNNRNDDRYFYPQMAGTYSASIHRIGVTASYTFGTRQKRDPDDRD